VPVETLMQGFRALKVTGQLSAFWSLLVPTLGLVILDVQILGMQSVAAIKKLFRDRHDSCFSRSAKTTPHGIQ